MKGILEPIADKTIERFDNYLLIKGFNFDVEDFDIWKQNIDSIAVNNESNKINCAALSEQEHDIVSKIKNFQVISKNPIECQQFIIELQNTLNGPAL